MAVSEGLLSRSLSSLDAMITPSHMPETSLTWSSFEIPKPTQIGVSVSFLVLFISGTNGLNFLCVDAPVTPVDTQYMKPDADAAICSSRL